MKLRLGDLPQNKIVWISTDQFEVICFNLAGDLLAFDQPIPSFFTRNPGILESSLIAPLQKFNKKDLYPSFVDKLTILFYLMIKNHPFQNGNKRIAIVTLLTILFMNGFWIKTHKLDPYMLAKYVAASKREDKDTVLKTIHKFISDNIVKG